MEEQRQTGQTRGLVVAGMGGGSGKSVVAVGLAAAFAGAGRRVVPFKKGPDYIDAGWLELAAGRPCYNLDPYLMEPEALVATFRRHAALGEMVVVEGNRGLYDGVDLEGSYSTAELAIALELPVVLVVNCTKTTRTVAAMVLGCRELDRRVTIAGVVLNRVGTARHEAIVRSAVEHYTGIPVMGAIPRLKTDAFPQRHLGITPTPEHAAAGESIRRLAAMAEEHLDLAALAEAMAPVATAAAAPAAAAADGQTVRIGVVRDAAFQFYYPENLEALRQAGAELIMLDALADRGLPELDGLYIGGGFPETNARLLADNEGFRHAIRQAAAAGLPIYAECGGLIYLGESIELDGVCYPLAGVFPVRFGLEKRPQAHGYTVLEAGANNPFYAAGTVIKGHEFRYSRVVSWDGRSEDLAFAMARGVGFVDGRDGLVKNNTLALYSHVHAVGTPEWAPALVARARRFREGAPG